MTTFHKVWALKVDHEAKPGEVVEVSLKSGEVKPVTVGAFAGKLKNGSYLYLPAPDAD